MEQPKTFTCPYCGNVNPYDADDCMKCQKPLGPIRQAMEETLNQVTEHAPEPEKSVEPPPPMPELAPTIDRGTLGHFISSRVILIRGMGNRAEEIAARFFGRLVNRDIQNLTLSSGRIEIPIENDKKDSRDYYFAEQDLGSEAVAIMAVRIAPSGTDLYVEWRNYALPPVGPVEFDVVMGCLGVLFYGLGLLYDIWYLFRVNNNPTERKSELKGFQAQDNLAFQLSVRAALEEAIDQAGISRSFIQGVSHEGGEKDDQRLI